VHGIPRILRDVEFETFGSECEPDLMLTTEHELTDDLGDDLPGSMIVIEHEGLLHRFFLEGA
jgi:hypothetical protein